jgi:23S rRNA U2552 (ribose-2'-O)-methylase RlmE/FtsJ
MFYILKIEIVNSTTEFVCKVIYKQNEDAFIYKVRSIEKVHNK